MFTTAWLSIMEVMEPKEPANRGTVCNMAPVAYLIYLTQQDPIYCLG